MNNEEISENLSSSRGCASGSSTARRRVIARDITRCCSGRESFGNLNPDRKQEQAAVDAVRAAHRYPSLAAALERAGIVDVTVIAAAARRTAQLADIGNANDAVRASAQFQGLLALLQRATLRGSISISTFADRVTTLAAVDLGDNNAYEGRLVRWLGQHDTRLNVDGDFEAQPMERALLDLRGGPLDHRGANRRVGGYALPRQSRHA